MTDTPPAAPAAPRLRDLIIERVSHALVGAVVLFALRHGLVDASQADQLSGWLAPAAALLLGGAWIRLSASRALRSWLAALNAPPPAAPVKVAVEVAVRPPQAPPAP